MKTSRSFCSPRSLGSSFARMPAVWAYVSTFSIFSMFDYLRVSCSMEDRVIEYVDHLHEHFVHTRAH